LLDDYPTSYETYSKRNHRWIRGDWQIISWVFANIKDREGKLKRNNLSSLSKWKIIDNLRRSLVIPTTFLWLILSWTVFPGHLNFWTLFILIIITLPIYAHSAGQVLKYPKDLSFFCHLKGLYHDIKINLAQLGITVMTLHYQALIQLNAIFTSLYRVYISKKNLLQWTTAAQAELKNENNFTSKLFYYSVLISVLITFALIYFKIDNYHITIPFILLWISSPYLLKRISETIKENEYEMSYEDRQLFHQIACRTWNFFETFVNIKSNWLPPDNFQQEPKDLIAFRTSPTNIGLYMLSCCSAYNFGYIGQKELIERLENTLLSLSQLPRKFGHFYNWYDIEKLEALSPIYISTVDSGNFAGHLIAVKQTCLDISQSSLNASLRLNGFIDYLHIIKDELNNIGTNRLLISNPKLDTIKKRIISSIKYLNERNLSQESIGHILDTVQSHLSIVIKDIKQFKVKSNNKDYGKALELLEDLQERVVLSNLDEIKLQEKSLQKEFKNRLKEISYQCNKLFYEMDFSILYDNNRKLFSIGYNVLDGKNDDSFYDLLASEARLTSLISIAKGDIPENHWFHLGRQMTSIYHSRALISWSASMFEYLMPLLVTKDYFGTILHETYKSVVSQQIAYGRIKKRPWGLSESAYNARDLLMNYQYGPFGVPGLGLKRGLSQDYVISPYSSLLSSMVLPNESIQNIKDLIGYKFLTEYGFYEAIDYTENRLPPNQSYAIIKNFMAHHQGMSLIALDNILHSNIVRERFHNDPIIKTSELLLQERVPQRVSITHPRKDEVLLTLKKEQNKVYSTVENITQVNSQRPQTRILSNGNYTIMTTATGSGFSDCENKSVLRWYEDPTFENQGSFFFINDLSRTPLKSLTFSPLNKFPNEYKTTFSDHKAEFWYNNKKICSHTEVIVSAEDNLELRRITLTNLNLKKYIFDLTSYSEPVLSEKNTDISHPSFNKLFIETEYIPEKNALLARRRKKDKNNDVYYGINQIVFDKNKCSSLSYETDREKFFGRRNSWQESNGLKKNSKLSNTVGGVLDPIFSFKTRIELEAYETTTILFVSGMTKSKNEALRLIDQYHDFKVFEREEKMSWTKSQVELRHLDLEPDEVNTFQKLASALLYSTPQTRPPKEIMEDNLKSQSDLWSYGLSGDLPTLVVLIKDLVNLSFIQDILQFHEYLKKKSIDFDLIFITDETSIYRMTIHDELFRQIRIFGSHRLLNKKGGIFVFQKSLIPESDFDLFKSIAHIYLSSLHGTLKNQVNQLLKTKYSSDLKEKTNPSKVYKSKFPLKHTKLDFFNGYGGFKNGGKEYQIILQNNKKTPAPWVNVIANSNDFGFIISESGSGYTWSKNSRENKITPWNNDSILDPPSEILYIKDNDNKSYWSPTAGPLQNEFTYLITHGQGYTRFEHTCSDIYQNLLMYVSMTDEVKYFRLSLKNQSKSKRNISVFLYLEWILGFHKTKTSHHIITEKRENIFCAQNKFSSDFIQRLSYVACDHDISTYTCDRGDFLGRYRSYKNPIGLEKEHLNMKIGAGLDPCLAIKTDLELDANEEKEITFILGQTNESSFNPPIINKLMTKKHADKAFQKVNSYWNKKLNKIQIKTNHLHLDILANSWLLYQTLSCRIWARTGFYQSGGAYGFRDQLQDVTSLLHTAPEIARSHIIKAASHQFPEGDVLHWWHPPLSKGVRTRFSDDLLWLPYVTDLYIEATGDTSILDEVINFIQGPLLETNQDDIYIQATKSKEDATLYEHCTLALDSRLKLGQHCLPLIGSGDWNDGMNTVGNQGYGESIWMAWFLGYNLLNFRKYCFNLGDLFRDLKYKQHISKLKKSLETTGWDGKWYRRAYFDDGTPLGSETNDECKIDSITQSWSVLSNLGSKEHQNLAMHNVKKYLINNKDKIIHLFQPAFNTTKLEPGYIKAYLPGIRENGGQYTHAAIWLAMAYAKHNDADTAIKIMNYINPIKLSLIKKKADKYKLEPYVIAADVYSNPSHTGKGGWSWYTGSSGWYYRAILESLLGLYLEDQKLILRPSFPEGLKKYNIRYIFGKSHYNLNIKECKKSELFIDNNFIGQDIIIPLVDDAKVHVVNIQCPRYEE
jgi:cyclic beta-1,2-glucan synthetase